MSGSRLPPPLATLHDFLQARRTDAPAVTGLAVALSGGPDSLALLLAAARVAPGLGYRLRALHVHHGLHPDADAWAGQAQDQARAAGVACAVLRVQVPDQASLEAAARQARYDALMASLDADEALLLGHHQDDQAETLLLRLLRGAGMHGLSCMRPLSVWHRPNGDKAPRWRPWLKLSRAALQSWRADAVACLCRQDPAISEIALQPVSDPANRDLRFDRSLLRHELLPLLVQRWPAAAAQLARSADQMSRQAQALDALADYWLGQNLQANGTLALPALRAIDDITRQAVVARWLAQRGAPPLPVRHWPRLQSEMLLARADARPQLAWPGWSLRRYREALYLLADVDLQPLPAEGADWPDPRQPLSWARRVWYAHELVPGLATDDPRLAMPWRLQPLTGGERWRPPGKTHSVSLKHWCQQQGIPPWQRAQIACLWVGEAVVAVAVA